MPTSTAGRDSSRLWVISPILPISSNQVTTSALLPTHKTASRQTLSLNLTITSHLQQISPFSPILPFFSHLGDSAIYSFDWSETHSDSPNKSQSSEAAAAIVYHPIVMVQPEERDYRWALPHLPPPVFLVSLYACREVRPVHPGRRPEHDSISYCISNHRNATTRQ